MFTIAVIGHGYWGSKLTSKWAAIEEADLRHVCDLRPDRANAAGHMYKCDTSTDYHKMLADPAIKAVNIATPIETHFAITRDALNAGKHVLVEKPLSCSVDEVDELSAIANEKGLILMAGHTFLFSQPVLKAKELLDRPEFGKIDAIFMKRNNLGRHKKTNNVLWDLAPHDISILDYWLKREPIAVQAAGVTTAYPGVVDVAVMNLFYPNDTIVNVQLSWKSPTKDRDSLVIGRNQMLVYDDTKGPEAVKLYNTGLHMHPELPDDDAFEYYQGDIFIPDIPNKEPLMSECRHFMECVQQNKEPFPHAIHARRVVHIIQQAEYSMNHAGIRVDL